MDDRLEKKIPRDPHWRWVTYHTLLGRDHEDIDEGYRKLARYLKDTCGSKLEMFESVNLKPLLKHEKEGREDIEEAQTIRDRPPLEATIKEMMLEHCGLELIQEAVYHKFKTNISTEGLEAFKTYWWDIDKLDAYDFASYYHESTDQERPTPPSQLPGPMRSKYLAYKNGADIELDGKEVVSNIMADAYFRAKELERYGMATDDEVRKYQKNALAAFRSIQEHTEGSGETDGLPEEIRHEVVYPDKTAASVESLDNYDPSPDVSNDENSPAYKEEDDG